MYSVRQEDFPGGVAAAFPQAEDSIDHGIVSGMTATDAQKISSLKHAAPALWRGCVFDVHIGLIRGKTIWLIYNIKTH